MGRGTNSDALAQLSQGTDRQVSMLRSQGAEEAQNVRDWYAGLGKIAPNMVEGYQKGQRHGRDIDAADQQYDANAQTMAANKLKMDAAARRNTFLQSDMGNGKTYEQMEAAAPALNAQYASEEHPLHLRTPQDRSRRRRVRAGPRQGDGAGRADSPGPQQQIHCGADRGARRQPAHGDPQQRRYGAPKPEPHQRAARQHRGAAPQVRFHRHRHHGRPDRRAVRRAGRAAAGNAVQQGTQSAINNQAVINEVAARPTL
jgi:hypothetical protein